MTPEQFARIGAALYGPQWGAPDFSADLGVSERRVRRWISGKEPIPISLAPELIELCTRLRSELDEIVRGLEALAREAPAATAEPRPGSARTE